MGDSALDAVETDVHNEKSAECSANEPVPEDFSAKTLVLDAYVVEMRFLKESVFGMFLVKNSIPHYRHRRKHYVVKLINERFIQCLTRKS